MNNKKSTIERDELRARFTAWLNILLRRAKLNYIERELTEECISLDSLDEDLQPASEDDYMQTVLSDDPFEFREERLARAYAELPLMRQQILKFLFVDELKPKEIARLLNCSAAYVSDQRYKSLSELRKKMQNGGESDE